MFSKVKLLRLAFCVAFATLHAVKGATEDLPIYTDSSLAKGWENWSWSSDINFAATDLFAGASGSSISVNSTQYAALSVKLEGTFPDYAGLRFDIAGAQPDITLFVQSTVDGTQSPSVSLSSISKTVVDGAFSSLLIDFNNLPGSGAQLGNGTWDRLTIQAGGNGAFYHIDNVVLVSEIFITPEFLSAEPLTNNVVAVTTVGAVNLTDLHVALDGKPVKVSSQTTYNPVDTPAKTITYLTLASPFGQGNLTITAGTSTFSYALPAVQRGHINKDDNHPINPHVYGVNFPTSASYIQHLGVTVSRWGGNAVTAYNPFGGFTNAGNDWYFENRASDSADEWIGWVNGAGSDTLLTIPSLDWVSKDASSYSYPKSVFPDQTKFDPYNSDAGSGLFPNGSYVTPVPNQSSVYTPWNTTAVKQWLTGLANKPSMVSVDNEIEIASNTHQDMHPEPMGFDEELSRVIDFATAAKEALPDVLVVAPSTCSWWFYWTSSIGYSDNAAHNNTDFLPWFLAQMSTHHLAKGKRLLDYLDIHYYFQADTSANDAAAKALRLRATRSIWDPTYIDESWAGSNPQNHQPNPTAINLLPRFHTLIEQNYPGTKLSISEWSSTADNDITGGLVTVDVLGLWGKFKVDSSTYWATPDELGPIGLAYWLYRGYGTFFGSASTPVHLSTPNPDTQGIYAAVERGKLSLVFVNKNPDTPIAFDLDGVPTGKYFVRHFGGAAGVAKWQTTITLKSADYVVVPAYTAVFLQQK
ncbi:hypothetical protein GALMADRAFT_72267 [Galerina marginata CBS 339.88]|uniref:Glycoside hydrolase family 44 catalytic domain-containing protein n=1 Tax=Galerina marginata (strain CBS 339.88) TaxID=685588 RepID=A0A067T3H6_GALM3|nr:hypothetical protein GALMADRAFT_72267 [Galerina marginata CBS 339.88]